MLVTGTGWPDAADSSMASRTSSTWKASWPLARGGRPARMARAISSTPTPRSRLSPGGAMVSQLASGPGSRSRRVGPSKPLTGTSMVPCAPEISNACRLTAESKL